METHLTEGCKIASKACDCCVKAANRIEAYAKESVPIAARQGKDTEVYSKLAEWAKELKPLVTREAVNSGAYERRYPIESGNASKLRKTVEGSCPTCADPKRLSEFLKGQGEGSQGG